MQEFLFQALFLRAASRLRGLAHARQDRDAGHHLMQALQRFFAVLFQAAVRLCLDDDHAVLRDALIVEAQQALFQMIGQRRRHDIEAQMNRIRHLVDILSAGALRAYRAEFNFAVGNLRSVNDEDPLPEALSFIL
jgi:hypothetical protein